MKSLSLIFICLLFVCACNNRPAKKEAVAIKTLNQDSLHRWVVDSEFRFVLPHDTNKLLTLLFNPVKIVKKIAYWKPDGDAWFNMNVSEDGYCHTNIDTILETDANTNKCLVIFTTIDYDMKGEVDGPHPAGANYGVAIFNRTNKGYELRSFQRCFTSAGTCGYKADSIGLEKFGSDTYLLMIEDGWTGGGCCSYKTRSYYNVDNESMAGIFDYEPYWSDEMFHDSGSKESITINKQLVHGEIVNGWNDFKILCSDYHYDTIRNKWVTIHTTEYYTRNDDEGAYELIKK